MRGPIARGELGGALCSRRAAATKRRIDQTTVRAARLQARPDTKGGFFGHFNSVPFPFGLQDFNGHAQPGLYPSALEKLQKRLVHLFRFLVLHPVGSVGKVGESGGVTILQAVLGQRGKQEHIVFAP